MEVETVLTTHPPLPRQPSRRTFATTGAAAVAAMIVPRHVLGGAGYQAPSDTLRIAAVGIGGMGVGYMQGCAGERFVALCDVDDVYAGPVFAKYPEAKRYRDFRQMFDKEEKNIDAVIVATPDHTHAPIILRALGMHKHVYGAKPLAHTITEVRRIAAAARNAKVATQMSVQSCASPGACAITEMLLSGAIGPVREVHIWVDHPVYPAGVVRPTAKPPVPQGLDWDLWLGPAPYRPYHPAYHPWIWRAWWDFGTGTVGDMACHLLHFFYHALKLGAPSTVQGRRTAMFTGEMKLSPIQGAVFPPKLETPESESYACMLTWDFPERAGLPALRLHWYDGGLQPPRPLELDRRTPMPGTGMMFVGDKGKFLPGVGEGNGLLPADKFKGFPIPGQTLRRSPGHYKEWVDACKLGTVTSCPFEFGANMTELTLLGTLAARSGRLLEWDAARLKITNDAEANGWLNTAYREGWSF